MKALGVSRVLVLFVLAFISACSRDLALPEPRSRPVITGFEPSAAFAGEDLVVYGNNFDEIGNQLIFGDGVVVLAELNDAGTADDRKDGGFRFKVPIGLEATLPLVISNTVGRSAPSDDSFTPLGTGFPSLGQPVASIRFRHAPVGLVDRFENVLLASTLFDILVTDGRAYSELAGRPVGLVPVTQNRDQAFVAFNTLNGGQVALVTADKGALVMSGPVRDFEEEYVLPGVPPAVGITVARSPKGEYVLTEWRTSGNSLQPNVVKIPVVTFRGASAQGGRLAAVGRGPITGPDNEVFYLQPSGWTPVYPYIDAGIQPCADHDDGGCPRADGPVAIVPRSDGGVAIVAALETGDLMVIDGQDNTARREIPLISYATIDDIAAGTQPDKVVFSKSRDGALFQLDLETEELDWAVPLRGEPTRIAVAPDIDEVAVANRIENAVDTVVASTGQWSGRISLDLGLGAAPGNDTGGIVPAYSYDPRLYPDSGVPEVENMHLLMRNIGTVLEVNASSFEFGRMYRLIQDAPLNEPMRLVSMQPNDLGPFVTVVVHRNGLGKLIEPTGEYGEAAMRTFSTPSTPIEVVPLRNHRLVIAFPDRVAVYAWGADGMNLALLHQSSETVVGVTSRDDHFVVVTQQQAQYRVTEYSSTESVAQSLEPKVISGIDLNGGSDKLEDFIKAVTLKTGPSLFFASGVLNGDRGPYVWFGNGDPTISSLVTGPTVAGTTPDGKHLVWLDQRSSDAIVRVLEASSDGIVPFSSYRVAGQPAGGDFDPSGEYLFLPIPSKDQLDVVQ